MTMSFLVFFYFIAVSIGKTCSMSLMRFNNHIFYILFYLIADFKQDFKQVQYSQCFKVLMLSID